MKKPLNAEILNYCIINQCSATDLKTQFPKELKTIASANKYVDWADSADGTIVASLQFIRDKKGVDSKHVKEYIDSHRVEGDTKKHIMLDATVENVEAVIQNTTLNTFMCVNNVIQYICTSENKEDLKYLKHLALVQQNIYNFITKTSGAE